MPFPSEPLVLRGGCNCTAVRWRMSLPDASERVANPYHTPGTNIGDIRLPTAVVCHCDGCRQATGSLGAYGFTSDMALLELSILSKASMPNREKNNDDETRPPYVLAASLMDDPTVVNSGGLWLMHYESSPKRDRWFCGRCGTQIAIAASKDAIPPEWGWPRVVNIWAGTMDRNLLENDWCRPDHIMDCSIAIPWIRDYVKHGAKDAQEHPFIMIDWHMTDDFRPHIEMLNQMGVNLNVTMWK
ncbi:hypothetical protein EG329_011553 [Mollisiaceae sp. DMI_Dod_QoI]|nr:hypothetical protein EG329_011553 [Helotiales sp. DMI_Dod_QoI]